MAASKLARNKVLGHDGIPAEFCVMLWDQIGPVLLEVLCEGLEAGMFHLNIARGIIVLLAKKGDQLLLHNKRGLALLNYCLKSLTKLYQLQLSLVLQDFIEESQ